MINFSGISKNSIIGKTLRLFLYFIPKNINVFILQGRLKGKRWIKGSGVNGYWLGTYELEKQKMFEQQVKSGNVVFDIGANVGFYSLLAAELAGESGKVFSFEPFPENFKYLKQHIKINNYGNIFPYQIAISDKNSTAFFSTSTNSSTGHIGEAGEIKVETIALDEWVKDKKLPVPNVLKIDVEGAEVLVLKGALFLLSKHHPKIFLAVHSPELSNECLKVLKSLGYDKIQSIGDSESGELLIIKQ